MELIILLLLIISFLWFLTILITKDIFCPSAIICESYIIAILCSIYNYNKWDMNFHFNTFLIILTGIIIFLFVSYLYNSYAKKRNSDVEREKIQYIKFKKINIIIINIVSLICFLLYTKYFLNAINSFSNVHTFSQKMEMYRNKTVYEGYIYIPTLINFLSKICRAVAIIYAYIIINNGIYNVLNSQKNKDSNFIHYILGIAIYIPISIFGGARFDMIVYAITCVMIWYIIYNKYSNRKMEIRKIIKIIEMFMIIVIIFSISKNLVGRNNNSNTSIDYITQYFGGSMHCFDVYMQEEHSYNGIVGQELFAGIRKFLHQVHILEQRNVSKDVGKFVYTNDGIAIGNIYSAFRHMYHDFGYIGIIIFQGLLSIIFNKFYRYILFKNDSKKSFFIDYDILIYTTSIFCLFFHSYSEFFYSTILSFNYIMLFIWMKLILIWLNKVKVR